MKGLSLLTLVGVLLANQGLAQGTYLTRSPQVYTNMGVNVHIHVCTLHIYMYMYIHKHVYTTTIMFIRTCIDQCTSTEQVESAHRKLQEQLDRTKAELDSWQNQTLQFVQCPGQSVGAYVLLNAPCSKVCRHTYMYIMHTHRKITYICTQWVKYEQDKYVHTHTHMHSCIYRDN